MQTDALWRQEREACQQAAAAGHVRDAMGRARKLLSFGRAADVAFCATAFRRMRDALLAAGHRPLKTFLVRSVTVEPMLPALQVEAVLGGYVLNLEIGGYGSYLEELFSADTSLGRFGPDLVFVLLDTEELAGRLPELCASGQAEAVPGEVQACADRLGQMLRGFRSGNRGRLVVQGCVLPEITSLGPVGDANVRWSLVNALRELNRQMAEVCRTVPDCAFLDVDRVAGEYGRARWRDERMFLASRLPVAPGAFTSYAHGLMRTASALLRTPRKVLCTDLDNTFWGGVLGEEGPSGIATGHAFPGNCYFAYQRFLKELSARGILVAVTSKNNEEDVAEAFRLRSADLAFGLEDFVARKIGWNDKTDALRELAAELSLGLNSFVFVDDNPTECEAVRQHLPEVAVLEVLAEEPWRTVDLLGREWLFDIPSVTADDRNRSGEYQAQAQRMALQNSAANREEFLASLGIVCTFLNAADAPLDRSVQLLAKTNQFNLTTRRYSATEVLGFVDDPRCQAVAVRVRDRFGDAGVVGLALTRLEGDVCRIDSLLLSCRVIGRGIETAMLSELARHATQMGARWLLGEYIETKKNVPCREFYPQHAFMQDDDLSADGVLVYRLPLLEKPPQSPSWLSLEGKETYEFGTNTPVPA